MAASQDEIYSMVVANTDNEVNFFSQQDNFNCFIKESIIYSLSLEGDKIHYKKAENCTDVKEFEIYKEHMRHHLRKQIFGSPVKPEIRTFSDFILNFQINQPKKKLFCRYEKSPNINNKTYYYLVKKYFTEGVQYVMQGERHTYKAIGKPLYIYISNTPLELKTFRTTYQCIPEQIIKPGETKIVPSNTYYFVIARCHAVFKKVKISSHEVEDSIEMPRSIAPEANSQIGNETEDRNQGLPRKKKDRMSTLSQPFQSRSDERYNARRSLDLDGLCKTETVIDDESTNIRASIENIRQSLQAMSGTPGPRPSTSWMETSLDIPPPSIRNEMEVLSNTDYSNNDYGRAAFAIRKDSNIESYTLMSDSTFCILQDNTITGSFAIGNEDMDPYVIEYHSGAQFIREVATFRNGSTFETTLPVQRGLLNELRDPTRRKEKIVVNYFFDLAFKSIEAAYKRFSEMRNIRMIGSCVPAIPLSNARFIGTLSDAYEAKP